MDNEEADAHSEHHSDANNEDNTHASAKITAGLQVLHDHLDHVCEEVTLLNYLVANMETFVTSKVSEDITSSMPTMINNASKYQLPGLLSETLKKCLPNILKETLQTQTSTIFDQMSMLIDLDDILYLVVHDDETVKGEKFLENGEHPSGSEVAKTNEEKVLILYPSEAKKEAKIVNVADSSDSDDLDSQPL
nr:hypothetical protein [Tanacetum cinerariifolium]